jgi:ElaB/YqjD/DUF883 family membrane-anchored ribosome-binding protein
MASRAKRAKLGGDLADIDELIADLEKRLGRLNSSARRQAKGASSDLNGFVAVALSALMQRMREGADVTEDATERAIQAGNDVFKRLGSGLERHPLVLLAIAAGAGFLLGMARR